MKKTSGSLLSPSFSRWRRGHHCLSNEERSSNVFPLGPGLFPVIQRLGRRNPCSDMLLPTDYSAKEQIWVSQCRGAHGKFLHYLGSYVFNTSALCYRPRHALHLFLTYSKHKRTLTYASYMASKYTYLSITHSQIQITDTWQIHQVTIEYVLCARQYIVYTYWNVSWEGMANLDTYIQLYSQATFPGHVCSICHSGWRCVLSYSYTYIAFYWKYSDLDIPETWYSPHLFLCFLTPYLGLKV
jgi:hypothetical protein